jgi:hypothetical protein
MRILSRIIIFILLPTSLFAQLSLQSYTPSALLGEGNWEFKSFQNLYRETQSFGEDPFDKIKNDENRRSVYFTSINQFLYGLTPQLNVGLDLWASHVDINSISRDANRWGISGFGPKIKIAPFRKLPNLSVQSTFLFPLTQDLESRKSDATDPFLFLAFDRYLWLTQFFYDQSIGSNWQLFLQTAFWYSIVRDSFVNNNFLDTQFNGFLSYFPSSRWTVYGMLEYFPRHYDFQTQMAQPFNIYFAQAGLGAKYQLIPQLLELELLYSNFFMGSPDNGAGQTFNLGVRIIQQ